MLPILVRLRHPGPVLCVCTGAQPYGCLVACLVSLTEKGNENRSQGKGSKKAPTIRPGLERISWNASGMAELCPHLSVSSSVHRVKPEPLRLGQLGPVRNPRAEKYPYLVEKVKRVCQRPR
jgi:hypothetical protein